MTFTAFLFYCFAGVLIASALGTVFSKQPVHSALSLVLCFVTMAAMWVMMGAEFLGLALVVIYVGAVMVFFLFVIMMLDLHALAQQRRFNLKLLPLALVGVVMFAEICMLIVNGVPMLGAVPPQPDHNTERIGAALFDAWLLPLEIIAVLLLAAMIAAIGLTHRANLLVKRQKPEQQIAVTKEERLTIVKMKSEHEEPEPDAPSQWK